MAGKQIPVIISTKKDEMGGMIVFGYIDKRTVNNDCLKVSRARLVLYWNADVMGFMGLAHHGPNQNCRIGPEVDIESLRGITSVTLVREQAEAKWKELK